MQTYDIIGEVKGTIYSGHVDFIYWYNTPERISLSSDHKVFSKELLTKQEFEYKTITVKKWFGLKKKEVEVWTKTTYTFANCQILHIINKKDEYTDFIISVDKGSERQEEHV